MGNYKLSPYINYFQGKIRDFMLIPPNFLPCTPIIDDRLAAVALTSKNDPLNPVKFPPPCHVPGSHRTQCRF